MSLFHRFTAIVLQCAVLALPLTSGALRCEDGAGHSAHMDMDMADMSMPGMSMPGMSMPGMSMPGMPMPGDGADGSANSHSDCSLPWSSGPCQSMASCAPGAMSIEQPTIGATIGVARDEPTLPGHDLRSVTRAPEPPPPRA